MHGPTSTFRSVGYCLGCPADRREAAMPEEINVEFSHKLSEQEDEQEERQHKRKARWEVLIEIVEVAVLAIVAIATAWSGYQAARWDGQQSLLYGQATADRFKADAASTYGGQELSADSAMFTAYLQARSAGDSKLEMLYIRRFTPDYRVAFAAWLKTEPFTNPAAPPGPGYMPQYRNPSFESAARLNTLASATFDQGTAARDTAERYVRDTVLFASVLFLVAIAQRFKVRSVRVATTTIAFALAAYTTFAVAILPRILSRSPPANGDMVIIDPSIRARVSRAGAGPAAAGRGWSGLPTAARIPGRPASGPHAARRYQRRSRCTSHPRHPPRTA
jgi:hypothetical protein